MTHDDAERPAQELGLDDILEAIERENESEAAPPAELERVPYLGFFLGPEIYGLPLGQLREVAQLTRVRRIPGAPASVAGLVNLRGEIICALDARAILGLAMPTPPDAAFLLVLRGVEDPLGLVVDSIANIYSIDPGQIEPPPSTWPPERAAFFVGTARVSEGLMGLLEVNRVVST